MTLDLHDQTSLEWYFNTSKEHISLDQIHICTARIANLRPHLFLAALSWRREGVIFTAAHGARLIASYVGADWLSSSEAAVLDSLEPEKAWTMIREGVSRINGAEAAAELSLAQCTVMICWVSTAAMDNSGKNEIWRSLCRTAIRMYDAVHEAKQPRDSVVNMVCVSDVGRLRSPVKYRELTAGT